MLISDTEYLLGAVRDEVLRIEGLDEHTVRVWDNTDIEAALLSVKNYAKQQILIVPSALEAVHEAIPGHLVRTILKRRFAVLVVCGSTAANKEGMREATRLMDAIFMRLMRNSLGIDGAWCLPQIAVPMQLDFNDAPARGAWQMDFNMESRAQYR